MKKVFLLMLTISTLLSACKKDKVNGGNMSYKVDGTLVTTKSHNASYGNLLPAFMTTNITSSMHTDKRSVNININAVKTGTYNFVSNTSTANTAYGFYYPDYFDFGGDVFAFKTGSIEITAIDTIAKTFSATFSGTAKEADGRMVTITEGIVTNATLTRF